MAISAMSLCAAKECDQNRSGLRQDLGRKLKLAFKALGEAGQEKAVIHGNNAGSLALAREAFIEFDKSSC
jgi:hypothetical protein